MFIKMKESKGFTLVELMIVVAIIGILAAVAVPFYQRYVQKSRLTSQVFPGMHSIETNIGAYYAMANTFMLGSALKDYMKDADTRCFQATWNGANRRLVLTITNIGSRCDNLQQLASMTLGARGIDDNGKIARWSLSGTLATELGLK